MRDRVIDGYRFEFDTKHEMYECRGQVCYDDYHDEVPEEKLWKATQKLAEELGTGWTAEHSEKGWVEVMKIPTIEDKIKLVKEQQAELNQLMENEGDPYGEFEEERKSECCGAKMIDDCDLCPECKEHTGQ